MSERPDRLLDGLWRWTARHPEWHPGAFGREVASFALDTGGRGLLVDPLLPPDPAAANRLADRSRFRELAPGGPAPPGVEAVHVGRPRRFEMPALIASHRAVAFGDAVVEVGGALRIWSQQPVDEGRAAWYRERFVPTLEPLLERDVERVLVTHGEPVLAGGRDALAAALARPPWH